VSYQAVEQEFIRVDPVLCFLPVESARIKNCDGLVGAELFTSGLKLSDLCG
jgi:hypothetical protein